MSPVFIYVFCIYYLYSGIGKFQGTAPDETYNVMVIGSVRTGKSTLCNFFFKEAKFKTGLGPLAITKMSNFDCCVLNGSHFKFIDTPGFGDGHDRVGELGEALLLADNKGVHAIAICINMRNWFTADTDGGLFEGLEILGNRFSHAFVVCTNGGIMGDSEKSQEEKLAEWLADPDCPKQMGNLFKSVQNRYIIVESESKGDGYYRKKSDELIAIVQKVYEKNGRQLYTNILFTRTKEQYHKLLESKDKENSRLSKQLVEKTGEICELQTKISHGENLKSNLERQLVEEKASANKLEEKEKQYKQKVNELKNELTGQNNEVQRLQRKVKEKEKEVSKKDEDITSLRQENKRLIDKVEVLKRNTCKCKCEIL